MDNIMHYPVKNVVRRTVIYCVKELDSLTTAIRYMEDGEVSALPVITEEGNFAGVITKSDITSSRFIKLLADRPIERIPVKLLMNKNLPVSVNESQTLADVVTIMHRRHIHRVFVTDADHRIIGLISTTDIIKLLFVENADSGKVEPGTSFRSAMERHQRYMDDISREKR
jgi:CBS domain-containing protein